MAKEHPFEVGQRWRVNNWIGQWTKELTGMVNIQEGVPARSRLIESYSRLGYDPLESR